MTCDEEVVVLDFETTGQSPCDGRVIEVGAVKMKEGEITERFSQLMDPGIYIPWFITELTGINNEMVEDKPSPQEVMPRLREFIGDCPIVAHNAAFDKKFLYAEMDRAGIEVENVVLCTMLLARRLVPEAPDYKLGTLADFFQISMDRAHRALDDVEATAEVWNHLMVRIGRLSKREKINRSLLQEVSRKPKNKVREYLEGLPSL